VRFWGMARQAQPSKRWIVISYYTRDTAYQKEIQRLEESLKLFNLPYCFFEKPPLGSWRRNLNFKSSVILEAFKKFKKKDIVFIDADGIVRKYPILFDELSKSRTYHMACHYRMYKESLPGGSLLSGTLWFRNVSKTRKLVEKWHKMAWENMDVRHQHCLNLAIHDFEKEGKPVKVFRLPQEYTKIFDSNYTKGLQPVIEHFQASRRFRHKVGYGGHLVDSNFTSLENKGKVRRMIYIPQKTDSKYKIYRVVKTSDIRSDFRIKRSPA
jgi:hypothetical protein